MAPEGRIGQGKRSADLEKVLEAFRVAHIATTGDLRLAAGRLKMGDSIRRPYGRFRPSSLLMKPLGHYIWVLRSRPDRLRFIAGRMLQKSGLSRFLMIDYGDFRLRFFPTNASALYWIDRNFIKQDADVIKRFVRPGETVVDVGANVGALSLVASTAVGPSGRVFAIEPHPRTFEYLQHNIHLNRRENVVTLNYAVGATAGTFSFSDLDADDQNAVIEEGGLEVPAETLDALLDDWPGPIALLKVDVEGFERYVFEGAHRVLERTECVYFEADERNYARYGYTSWDVIALLKQFGFHAVRPSADSLDVGYRSEGLENLLAVCDLSFLAGHPTGAAAGGD